MVQIGRLGLRILWNRTDRPTDGASLLRAQDTPPKHIYQLKLFIF